MGVWGGGRVWGGGIVPHKHVQACTCMHVYDIIGNSEGFPNGGSHLQLKL